MTNETTNDYDFFFAIKSSEVDAWEITNTPMTISKTNYVIGQYLSTEWFNKPVFDCTNNTYDCLVLKVNKHTNRKNLITRQLNYEGLHYSSIPEVCFHGVITPSNVMDAKTQIKKTIKHSQLVSVPVHVKMTDMQPGEELIITMQGKCIDEYYGDIIYSFTLPLFKKPIKLILKHI